MEPEYPKDERIAAPAGLCRTRFLPDLSNVTIREHVEAKTWTEFTSLDKNANSVRPGQNPLPPVPS